MAIRLIENRSEIGAGTRGSSLGIDALKVASLTLNSNYFFNRELVTISDHNDLLFKEIRYPSAKRIEGITSIFENISSEVQQTISSGDFPLILAADHASAGGTIAGIKKQFPNKRLGVIWIDAHADLHSPYTSPSGNVHGMPLATAIATDNLDSAVKEVSSEVANYWNQLKSCGGISPKIQSKDIVFYGVRDTEKPEDNIIRKEGIKNFTVDETRTKGVQRVCQEGLEILKDCDLIYISFDVDSMDCDLVSKGTGTPVPNGYSPEEVNEMIQTLVQTEKLVCFEMVEVNPILDNKGNKMAEVAFRILEDTTNSLYQKGV